MLEPATPDQDYLWFVLWLQPRFCASNLLDAQSVSARSPEGCWDSDGDEANLEVGAEMRQHHILKDRILHGNWGTAACK